jgi:hypothetical protein
MYGARAIVGWSRFCGSLCWFQNAGKKLGKQGERLATAQSHGTPQNFYWADEDTRLMVPNILHLH